MEKRPLPIPPKKQLPKPPRPTNPPPQLPLDEGSNIKIVCLGDSGIGKTWALFTYANKSTSPAPPSTAPWDYWQFTAQGEDVHLLDVGGQVRTYQHPNPVDMTYKKAVKIMISTPNTIVVLFGLGSDPTASGHFSEYVPCIPRGNKLYYVELADPKDCGEHVLFHEGNDFIHHITLPKHELPKHKETFRNNLIQMFGQMIEMQKRSGMKWTDRGLDKPNTHGSWSHMQACCVDAFESQYPNPDVVVAQQFALLMSQCPDFSALTPTYLDRVRLPIGFRNFVINYLEAPPDECVTSRDLEASFTPSGFEAPGDFKQMEKEPKDLVSL